MNIRSQFLHACNIHICIYATQHTTGARHLGIKAALRADAVLSVWEAEDSLLQEDVRTDITDAMLVRMHAYIVFLKNEV